GSGCGEQQDVIAPPGVGGDDLEDGTEQPAADHLSALAVATGGARPHARGPGRARSPDPHPGPVPVARMPPGGGCAGGGEAVSPWAVPGGSAIAGARHGASPRVSGGGV